MATVAELFTICTSDYLDDGLNGVLWDEAFMFRAINEAQLQACNRSNLIYDDTTASVCEIALIDGQASYAIDQAITFIEQVNFEGNRCIHKSKAEIEASYPQWRTLSGMTGKTVNYVVRSRSIRFSPIPDVSDIGKKVYLEVFRLPLTKLTLASESPEIPTEFHRPLIYWMLHEAYKKQDADAYNQERSDYFLNRFAEVFGDYIPAQVRINQLEQPVSMNLHGHAYFPDNTRNYSEDDNWK
jgi:hypothetical protein